MTLSFDPKSLHLYPDQPGVYLMKNSEGLVLYVGKAKNLKVRLKQYFAVSGDEREMIPYLIAQIAQIDTIVSLTEKDALILENTLIKRHQPKYNVMLKDDKTFISLLLTKHKWPMLQLIRYKGKPKDNGIYFGPYTNAFAARQIYDLLVRLFPLRQCSDSELASRNRPCLLYEIKRCCAPCVGKCTEEDYQTYVKDVTQFLKGKDKELLKDLKIQMNEAAEALEFEKASAILQTINQIEHVTTIQHLDNPYAKDCDSIGLYREADCVLISLLMFREGKIIGSEHFSFQRIISDDAETLESFILQNYKMNPCPKEIFVQLELPQKEVLEEILSVSISTPQMGRKRDLIEMALRNAKALFVREQDAKSLREQRLLDLQETLSLAHYPRRIECFDTSNIAGTDPVASLVCFINGEKDKSRKRLFKIKGEKGDDYSAMKEVIRRYFVRAKEKNDFCDLLIVDGGKGQLNLVLEIFDELKIATVDCIGVAKEDSRHDKGMSQEKIFLPHRKDPIIIDPRSPLLFLLQNIRDEAHKTAIEYHRLRRSKRTLSSELDDLEGIGPIKKKKLLQTFGSVKALKAASTEQIKGVAGINKKDLETIRIWSLPKN
jgi:excinuclease ABC subunit C